MRDRSFKIAAHDSGWPEQTHLPYAGEALKASTEENKEPAAVIVIDAFRFELGETPGRADWIAEAKHLYVHVLGCLREAGKVTL